MSDEDEKSSRLSLWSKRKLAVAEEAKNEALAEEEVIDEEAVAALALEHEANREAAEAVDLETMDEDTDFSVFMKDGVPDLLKKTAMAILWRSNPIFANVDGLVDYDDDFGSPDLIMKTFESAYKIGKGYLDKVEEEDEDKDKDEDEGEAEEVVEDTTDEDEIAAVDEEESADEIEKDAEEELAEVSEDETDVEPEQSEITLVEDVQEIPKISLRSRLMLDG